MLQTDDNQTEILLGTKQLLGIFFAIAVLLGVAFTGGYMIGKSAGEKKVAAGVVSPEAKPANVPAAPTGGETHSVAAASGTDNASSPSTETVQPQDALPPPETKSEKKITPVKKGEEPPLGSPRRTAELKKKEVEPIAENAGATAGFTPQSGQTFLQVAAVGRDEAEAVADVLHKKGFRAHAVPKPGNAKLYRVLIGPLLDAGDLATIRDSLRKTGFREVIVQKY